MDAEKIKANIAARKAKEAKEAEERAANGGKTLAELSQESNKRLLRHFTEVDLARNGRAFDRAISGLKSFLDNLPPLTEAEKAEIAERNRIAALRNKAKRRAGIEI